jgi:signal recognition particle GTPase
MKTPNSEPILTAKNTKPRFVMIGGFLGAGKTTAVGRLAAACTIPIRPNYWRRSL